MRYGLLLIVALLCVSSCAKTPPNFTPAGDRAFKAKQALDAIQALSQTAVNLNHATGSEHLTDRATSFVRDFALSATVAVQGYADGHDTLNLAVSAFTDLQRRLRAEPGLPAGIVTTLAAVEVALQSLSAR